MLTTETRNPDGSLVPEGFTRDAAGDVIPLPPDPGLMLDPGGVVIPLHLRKGEANATQPPTEGRIVRYVRQDGTFRAAIVAEVAFDGVTLLRPNLCLAVVEPRCPHLDVQDDVPYDPSGQQPHSWHWPSRA